MEVGPHATPYNQLKEQMPIESLKVNPPMIMSIQTFTLKDTGILSVPYTIEVDMSPHNYLFIIYKTNWGKMNKFNCKRKNEIK